MKSDGSVDLARVLLQLMLLGALIAGGFWLLAPFLPALAWATTMVVATWPVLLYVQSAFGGRRGFAVAVMTIGLLLLLILPLYAGIATIVENLPEITGRSRAIVELAGRPPPAWVESIPIVGSTVANHWRELAAGGPEGLSARLTPHVRTLSTWLLAELGGVGSILIQFLLAIGIAGVLYIHGETAASGLRRFARRVGGVQAESALVLAASAVRAVALGVGVTAMLQAVLAGIGLAVAGIPFAGGLAAVIFVLCVAQLGPILVLVPAIAWLYWQGQTGWAIALLIWSIPIGTLDNFVRPMLIKRGADISILLILPGVIGGLIAFGVIGLFIGPVLLAVGYTLLVAWVKEGELAAPELRAP
jgi:predicted PurR-regulated permease PerM